MDVLLPERQMLLEVPPHVAPQLAELIEYDVKVDLRALAKDRMWELDVPGFLTMYGKTVDLPAYIESHKTMDRSRYIKTGNVKQKIVFREKMEDLPVEVDHPDGLTPPAKNVRKARFEKARVDIDVEQVRRIEQKLRRFSSKAGDRDRGPPPTEMIREIELDYDADMMDDWPDVFTVERIEGRVIAATRLPDDVKERHRILRAEREGISAVDVEADPDPQVGFVSTGGGARAATGSALTPSEPAVAEPGRSSKSAAAASASVPSRGASTAGTPAPPSTSGVLGTAGNADMDQSRDSLRTPQLPPVTLKLSLAAPAPKVDPPHVLELIRARDAAQAALEDARTDVQTKQNKVDNQPMLLLKARLQQAVDEAASVARTREQEVARVSACLLRSRDRG